jgi:hypothetical protein
METCTSQDTQSLPPLVASNESTGKGELVSLPDDLFLATNTDTGD